jgi:hypothetical protein
MFVMSTATTPVMTVLVKRPAETSVRRGEALCLWSSKRIMNKAELLRTMEMAFKFLYDRRRRMATKTDRP